MHSINVDLTEQAQHVNVTHVFDQVELGLTSEVHHMGLSRCQSASDVLLEGVVHSEHDLYIAEHDCFDVGWG